jgi:ABC-type molybdate transport system substrate-binding protein
LVRYFSQRRRGLGAFGSNLDPCGYRSLMVLQLAEKHYNIPGLYDNIIANRPQEKYPDEISRFSVAF